MVPAPTNRMVLLMVLIIPLMVVPVLMVLMVIPLMVLMVPTQQNRTGQATR
jgi:hypothetical protein